MTPLDFRDAVMRPGMTRFSTLGTFIADVRASRRLMLAIAGQESEMTYRRQGEGMHAFGPARGFWQFELAGVAGVLGARASGPVARRVVHEWLKADTALRGWVNPVLGALGDGTPTGDAVAVAFARLLLWCDPRPLPDDEDDDAMWEYYVANWRPGKPRRDAWGTWCEQARGVEL